MSEEKNVYRIKSSPKKGLSSEQVQKQIELDLINHNADVHTKSIKRIVLDNTVTLFNILNIILGVLVFLVGSYKNMLFLGVMFCNIAIGIFQEIRAKKTIDKLSIISSIKAHVVRDGKLQEININDIVLDDIIELSNGSQIPSDCIILDGSCDVNESLLTGESDSIHKTIGDKLLSGSYIVSGKCRARVECVGKDNYASSISAQTKYVKKINSEIMETLHKIIKLVTIFIIPIGIFLALNQYMVSRDIQSTVLSTVTQLIGMIPEGLILLTSTVLAVSVIRLSQDKVLVQELYCIETLARVDTLCLDKTGTITEGSIELVDIIPYGEHKNEQLELALNALTSGLDDSNATFDAICERFSNKSEWICDNIIPFSSEKKWSGAHFAQEGTYVIGAAEFILKDNIPKDLSKLLNKYSKGYRSLIIVHSDSDFNERDLPDDIEICGLLLFVDKIRKEAPQTLKYFEEQNVDIKVISGDNALTVSDVARRAGVKNYDKYVDATTLKTDEDIKIAIKENAVFGRVTPAQKKKFVQALQSEGHVVAMTGDGVNDVLALKEADCSVAMASGSDAARNVSQLVLLNSNFSSMPKVVAEGRRTINNIERSASLFLVKSIYMTIMAIIFIFVNITAPFEPIQMTLVNAFTIGIPSFILALEPNKNRIKGSFFNNIMKSALSGGITSVISILLVMLSTNMLGLSYKEYVTLAVAAVSAMGLLVLFQKCLPFNPIRLSLFILMIAGLTVGIIVFKRLFSLTDFTWIMLAALVAITVISAVILYLLTKLFYNIFQRLDKKNKSQKIKKSTPNT